MTTVLVVDDSAVDRRLVGGLLEKDSELTLQYAVDGADAMAKIEEAAPDLVVTDLVMPEMDGLTLVATVRNRFSLVPVILMTSKGSEELAVQALQAGAASYVPKHTLSTRLADTVRNVLAISNRKRSHSRLMGSMTHSNCSFELENDSALIGPLISYVQEDCAHLNLYDDSEGTRVGVALEEALANALYHGNLEVDSELRESDDSSYWKLAEERSKIEPYKNRRIHVDVELSRDEAVISIGDEGPGFDPSKLPDPTDPANLEMASGRGILLMRTFMSAVRYNEAGNVVTLIKRRNAAADSPQGEDS
jgi:CheY-like chemotaxis protein